MRSSKFLMARFYRRFPSPPASAELRRGRQSSPLAQGEEAEEKLATVNAHILCKVLIIDVKQEKRNHGRAQPRNDS